MRTWERQKRHCSEHVLSMEDKPHLSPGWSWYRRASSRSTSHVSQAAGRRPSGGWQGMNPVREFTSKDSNERLGIDVKTIAEDDWKWGSIMSEVRHTKNPYLFHEMAIRVLSVLIFRTLPRPCFGVGELIPGIVVTLVEISERYKEQGLALGSQRQRVWGYAKIR